MKNIKDAGYVESLISFNDMKAFVCENREDQHKFSNQVSLLPSKTSFYEEKLYV